MTQPKRAHGSDRLTTGPDGELYLSCRLEKAWVARTQKELRRASFPGTCVNWDGELFEVVAAEPLPVGYRYTLSPWPEGEAIRTQDSYDESSERRRISERKEARSRETQRRISIALAIFVGLLPTSVQERLQSETGTPAATLTVISAIPWFLIGGAALIFLILSAFGVPSGVPTAVLLLGSYMFAESWIRCSVALVQGKPCGSLLGAIGFGLWRAVRAVFPTRASDLGR